MKTRKHFAGALALVLAIGLAGCQSMPKDALMLGPESLANRQVQTRRFDRLGEKETLAAGAGVLQDLGFTITESETSLGVVVGNKDRSAVNAGQIVGAVFVALLSGAVMPTDKNQKIIASLVTRPVMDSQGAVVPHSFFVRVTFARIVWNTQNQITKAEQLTDVELYEGFFDKLSKSVFLEGQKI
jgi:hypothetical protein